MFSLHHKKAVITGAGSGIGQAIARLFAQQGAEVHVIDRDESAAQATVNAIRANGGSAEAHPCDVVQQAQVHAVFNRIGAFHILVNNAGIAHVGKAHTTAEADFDRVMQVNVKGVYNCLHAAIPRLLEHKGGVILNIASIAAWVGLNDRFVYSATKGAVAAMTVSVAKDYLHDHIRCNSISPARIHTPFVDGFLAKNYAGREQEMFDKLSASQPIGRMGTPEEVATLALYLASDEASFITGCDYLLDGGFVRLNGS